MNHIRLNKQAVGILILILVFLLGSCEEIEYIDGNKYYIIDDVRKYMVDTTQTSFDMTDNNQISETFYIEKSGFNYLDRPYYHYLSSFQSIGYVQGRAYAENFNIAYKSRFSDYDLKFEITGWMDNVTILVVKWGEDKKEFGKREYDDNDDWFVYDFYRKKITSKIKPKIIFHDSMTLKSKTYFDIIEIDFSKMSKTKRKNAPMKIYFAGKIGLIKFVPIDNIELFRNN
jgi:hypothetical protein